MDRKVLISKLDEVSGDMDVFLGDESLLTAAKTFRGIQSKLDEIIGELQDEDESETDKEELDEPTA